MKYNRLGRSDLIVSEIGLGCMSLGTDRSKAIQIIHGAMDHGVNFIDTADLYDSGCNEELVGQAIQGRRDQVVLATKVGNRREAGQSGWIWDASKGYIKAAVKDSLRRLQTDYIDLYQLHGGTLEDEIDQTIEAFDELRQEGIIRYYGISSIRPQVIREYASRSSIVSVMHPYSILDSRVEESVLPYLSEQGISLIGRGPLAKGVLATHGDVSKGYGDVEQTQLTDMRERLEELGRGVGGLTTLALRYALSHPTVATIIPGASSLEQLLRNIEAANTPPLTENDVESIRQIKKLIR